MLLSCSASLRYIKNSRHKVLSSNQAEQADYFMFLTISLNGAIWVIFLCFCNKMMEYYLANNIASF